MSTDAEQSLIGEPAKLTRRAVPIGKDNSTKFKIDISRYEYCAEKVLYDIEGKKIYGYSPAMLVSEKLRAICQQMPSYSQHENDFESVRVTVVSGFLLQPFEFYFNFVCSKVLQLKPLWHE